MGIDEGSRLDDDLHYCATIRHSRDFCFSLGGCVESPTRATLPVFGTDLSVWSSVCTFGLKVISVYVMPGEDLRSISNTCTMVWECKMT